MMALNSPPINILLINLQLPFILGDPDNFKIANPIIKLRGYQIVRKIRKYIYNY